ncbi:tRNA (adenosine(37)-N6)-threonylcarbamoyltransferase complex ATPase subunit type 1 TsaE [Trichococcus ilyis]|uniref:tRNA threonylcarbamoyladenosine biosynthesis protein TsaE n=1 Tax=Trichococcus ilyis TaxID=640938 RepID=A0A143YEZ8_9LACT|nr:tRNA (adenosine(37)-N6)-threonylcarbamoyltransferase complex ATPase subunit type 1 TsaE [Trichococcus ilyis]CZQ86907.1 trna threonylcarbamoyl adenosine modification protein tsae [Trichococcus ilyis]SEI62862.1 tRNA threonylcarbamoyladenosine biosynthesis protein TsaE [Trichococcus ilyis]
MLTLQAKNEDETMWIAGQLAELLEPKDVILLEGNLGAGKTTFTKGLAKGLGIETVIKSPTYTLIREYTKGRLPLYHMDVYRLEDVGGDDLGFEEYLYGQGVSVIEWAEFIEEELPTAYLTIRLVPTGELYESREITFLPTGERYEALVGKLKEMLTKEG